MSLRYFHLEPQQTLDTVASHAFVLNDRLAAPENRVKCAACGRHVLNRSAHEALTQAELDEVATKPGALWYFPRETKAQALHSMGLKPGIAADGTRVWE